MAANVTVERTLKSLGEDGTSLKTMIMANFPRPAPCSTRSPHSPAPAGL